MMSNPMQRKARNSFLIGMLVALLISILIGVLLYIFVIKDRIVLNSDSGSITKYVYKLKSNKDIKSGDSITQDMVEEIKINSNYVSKDVVLARMKLDDKNLQEISFPQNAKSKIDLKAGTILSESMLYKDESLDNSSRLIEFNMITLPTSLKLGEYVDIRLMTPTGEDYIVLTKKCVKSIKEATIGMFLTEEEILTMNCAIIDAYAMGASNIYAIKYVEAGNQEKAEQTYVVRQSVLEQMRSNPNILSEARQGLVDRWETGGMSTRIKINSTLGNYTDQELTNIEEKMKKQIQKSKEQYLSGLEGY